MRNWSVNTKKINKKTLEYKLWKYEQLLNYGFDKNEKLEREFLEKYIHTLKVDEKTREYVKFLLEE